MSRYDGLIIPRSYSEYINKTDAATLSQALQLNGVMDSRPTENSNNAVRSNGLYQVLAAKPNLFTIGSPAGTARYYKIKNKVYSKVNNIYIGNRYGFGFFISAPTSAYSRIYRVNADGSNYGVTEAKIGTESNNGVCLLKINGYNPFTIVMLDSIYNADYEITTITETEWDAAENTLTNYIYYNDMRKTALICLPVPPNNDGTYILQCTVTAGLPAYSWVSTATREAKGGSDNNEENNNNIIEDDRKK